MPYYDFKCNDCGQTTEVKATISQKSEGLDVECKDCHSHNTEQVFLSVAVGVADQSFEKAPQGQACGSACGCFPQYN